ncbi:hypothetical protein BDV29DRAFT_186758 [Aspergillus leporis]|uniref:Uncharacterized protein n=1 Tax=Aspergillus leporis TaxID=41062 RepID=A0A5N5WGB7_9EURO|nr:hypothetical protein BDV29DRAFT_186758 [Aspergillus leporis]
MLGGHVGCYVILLAPSGLLMHTNCQCRPVPAPGHFPGFCLGVQCVRFGRDAQSNLMGAGQQQFSSILLPLNSSATDNVPSAVYGFEEQGYTPKYFVWKH